MNTYISTSEYMFRASLDYNKKLSDCTDQELEQIKATVLSRRVANWMVCSLKRELVTDTMRQKYGRDGWS